MSAVSSIVDRFDDSVNYSVNTITKKVDVIVTNPSSIKKVLQFATKVVAAIDLSTKGEVKQYGVTEAMQGGIGLLEFVGTFKNVIFWVNPFSKETFDQETFLQSLQTSLVNERPGLSYTQTSEQLIQDIFKQVMQQKVYHSKKEIRAIVVTRLSRIYDSTKVQQLVAKILIRQKSRPLIRLLTTACFTISDFGNNLLTLQKWHILDLSKLAVQIGSQSRVFSIVIRWGVKSVLGTIASVGLVLVIGEATYRLVTHGLKYHRTIDKIEKAEIFKLLKGDLMDVGCASLDLASAAAPLLFVINPPVVIALAIVAKGMGLVCILVRS